MYDEESPLKDNTHNIIMRNLYLNLVTTGGGYDYRFNDDYLKVRILFLLGSPSGHELINSYLFLLFTHKVGYRRAYSLLMQEENLLNKLSLNIINYLYREWDECMPIEWAFEFMDDWQVEAKTFLDKI